MIIFTFNSTHLAIAAENVCSNLKGSRLVPLPPKISAGCGLSLKVSEEMQGEARILLDTANIAYNGVYKSTNNGDYEKL